MQDRLNKLFKEINLEEEVIKYFDNASIEKVIVYDKNKMLDFIINTNSLIPIDIYNKVLDKLILYFNTIEEIKLIINPKNVDYSKLKEYYLYIMEEISKDRNKYQIFLERDIDIEDNIMTIKAYNKIECTNIIGLKQELIDKLKKYGFNIELNIDLEDIKFNDKINFPVLFFRDFIRLGIDIKKPKNIKLEIKTKTFIISLTSIKLILLKPYPYFLNNFLRFSLQNQMLTANYLYHHHFLL